jgi:hypothetical protein
MNIFYTYFRYMIIDSALRARHKQDGKFIKEYAGYVKKLRKEEKPNEYIRIIAMMLFPNEDSYKKRIIKYREWYVNKKNFLKTLKTYTISTMNCLKKSGLLPKNILAIPS